MLLWLDAGASEVAGRIAEGLTSIGQAITYMGPGSTAMLLGELELAQGDLRAAGGGDAVADWQVGLASARRVGLPMTELRALTRLVGASSAEERALRHSGVPWGLAG